MDVREDDVLITSIAGIGEDWNQLKRVRVVLLELADSNVSMLTCLQLEGLV